MAIKKNFHIVVCFAVLLLIPVTAETADINWATESYGAATLANIDGYVGDPGGPFGPPWPREDEKFGPPFPVFSSAVALIPGGGSCSHGISDITSSIMEVYAKACVQHGGVTSNSYAEASFTGTFIAENTFFLLDYSFVNDYFSSSHIEQWIAMKDLTDGTVFNNVYFDGLNGTIEVPLYVGHTIEVEFGLRSSAYASLEDFELDLEISETSINYSMSVVSMPIRIFDGPYYNSLQTAYDDALNNETIQILAVSLTGDLNINQPISVTLESGYNNIFTVADGITTLEGTMTVSDGDLTIVDGTFEIL